MDDLAILNAVEAIRRLKARYFRLLDTKQWVAWTQLFAEDLEFEAPGDRPGLVNHDRESFVREVRAVIEPATTVHHGHMSEIDILSPTSARAIWAMEDLLWWPEGTVLPGRSSFLHGFGHYHETYECSDKGWRIKTMKLTRLHIEHR